MLGWLEQTFVGGSVLALTQLAVFVVPFLAIAFGMHVLSAISQARLAVRFGWRSVLWTGWLGTPIHELSHAAMCLLFRHKIERIALFEPDEKSGRLGYVLHGYDPRDWYATIGNLPIGMAPLAGGSLVLYGLLWLFFPTAGIATLTKSTAATNLAAGDLFAAAGLYLSVSGQVLGEILQPANLLWPGTWLFLYLAVCVGNHLAPSPSDYQRIGPGVVALLAALWITNVLFAGVGVSAGWNQAVAVVVAPALGLFLLAGLLCLLSTAAIWGLTFLGDRIFGPPRYRLRRH